MRQEPPGRPSPELVAAYRAARYHVSGAAEPFDLTLDVPNRALGACHRAHGVECSTFLTAWNPGSRPMTTAVNAAAAARLAQHLRDLGHPLLAGFGADPEGRWPAEESVLALGVALEPASRIAREFGQAAFLHAGRDAIPRLVLLA
jgi:hypothetical protein